MLIRNTVALLSLLTSSAALAAGEDPFGELSVGVIASDNGGQESEDLQSSSAVLEGTVGLRVGPAARQTRIQATSTYYAYFQKKDRWRNSAEVEQSLRLGKGAELSVEAGADSNLLTLERNSTDQLRLAGQLRLEDGPHRLTVAGGIRRRFYDENSARSWAPYFDLGYRYRIGSWHFVELTSRIEKVDSDFDRFDYRRFAVSGYYTHPLGKKMRLRAGLTRRRWTWDGRLAPDGSKLRERLWLPQLRLTRDLSHHLALELDYRRVMRRSNDASRERNGNRFAVTLSRAF
jgi:hypothetical protein